MNVALTPVQSLAPHQVLLFLLQVGILLLVAIVLGAAARRVGLPAVVGELATGIVLGPSVLGRALAGPAGWLLPTQADQMHLLDAISQFAVLLLVGIAGAHLDIPFVRRRAAVVTRVSLGGLLIPLTSGVVMGYLVPASLLGSTTPRATFAAFLGVALCVSAIPVIAKTLADMNLLHRDLGQLTLAAASIEDAVGWLLLSLVSAMAVGHARSGQLAASLLALVGFIGIAATAGRVVVRSAVRVAGRSADPGAVSAVAVVIILLSAAASQALGLEAVFGAFVVGVLLGSPGVCDPRLLAPLRTVTMSVLAPIFLASAGLRVDIGSLRDPAALLAGLAILAVATVGKLAGGYAGARLSGMTRWEGLALGAGLNARGVIEVVVASVGLTLGVLTTATYTIIVLIAVLTSVMAPPLLRLAMARVEHSPEERSRAAAQAAWRAPVHGTDPPAQQASPMPGASGG
ncbi:MAG: cation:proton antiporter [Actinobacteria bacterium]|nr:cation:proton antiporter [Actinomycetota bacterium]